MNRIKKLLALLLCVLMLVSMSAVMTGCGDNGNSSSAATSGQPVGEQTTYTVGLQTAGGMALSGIDVYVYMGTDLQQYGQTDENGKASIQMPQGDGYTVQLSGVPKGYDVAESYPITGTNTEITLTSAPVQGESLSEASLTVGDVMYDFTVTTPDGTAVTLSEVLKEKKMVLLNFWYTSCSWCITEFPLMEEAYQMYKDQVEIIAVDPLQEGNSAIASFQSMHGLSFPMAECPAAWSAVFGISGYPTSVFIDQYGVICLIEAGAITSLRPFISAFDHFTAEDYEQKLCAGVGDLVGVITPNVTMDPSEDIAAAINSGDINVTYRAEEGDAAEMTWPFVLTDRDGVKCLKASNSTVDDSYAIIYADVELKAGQAVGFDYLSSSELGSDYMYVIVDGEDVYAISGADEVPTWKSCYPWVAQEDGVYEVALAYLKDGSDSAGEDTVYVKGMRVVDADDIDVDTYIPRQAAVSVDGFEYKYADIVFNEKDGYYHVGSANGPLLLANLMGYSQFNEEGTIYDMGYNGDLVVDGHNYYDDLLEYFNYASNSAMGGYCTVNAELAELLKVVADVGGFTDDENEWLKICSYYESYGPNGTQLVDPIKGLATFSAYTAKLGSNNSFYYDRILMPRGMLAEFVPNKSGVYRITSQNDSQDGVEGWIFNENREQLYVYEGGERMYDDDNDISMVYFMEAGKKYYIDIAFWDVYGTGTINYTIDYLGKSYDLFRACSPGFFTYDTDATGEAMYYTISGGIDVVLGDDGYYYEDLGDGKKGSKIYADFTGLTSIFDTPISTVKLSNGSEVKGMIDKGAFDFSISEDDQFILNYMAINDNDPEKTDEYLRGYWGEEYEAYAELYQVEDVYAGIYHGDGEDMTDEIKEYLDDIITSGSKEKVGCVPVDEQLAQLLQLLMDKYTFENVENSWAKLCYYYDHLG